MELFLVPALEVWSGSGSTGLPGKKLHFRILLGMRTGSKRNNHHKCLISQDTTTPSGRFSFHKLLLLGWSSWARRYLVFVSKVQLQGGTRGWTPLAHHGLALKSTHGEAVPWNLPAVTAQGPAAGLSRTRATQPAIHAMQFPATPTYCKATEGERGTLCLAEQLREMAAKTRAEPNGSFLRNSWQANILRSGKTKLLLSRGNQLPSINVSFCIESCANWNETIPDILKGKMEASKKIIYSY